MAKRMNVRGFLTYRETGSRLTVKRATGLTSTDLGPITMAEAHQKAWFNGVPLIVNGRIKGRATIAPGVVVEL